MDTVLSSVSIKNFKSVKDLTFDCKKVNIFIGKPNVGKSNILEAISLFSLPKSAFGDINKNIRLKSMRDLFFDNNTHSTIEVKASSSVDYNNQVLATITDIGGSSLFRLLIGDIIFQKKSDSDFTQYLLDLNRTPDFEISNPFSRSFYKLIYGSQGNLQSDDAGFFHYSNPIRCYKFDKAATLSNTFTEFLLPQDGQNLVTIVQSNNALFDEVQSFFEEYGFELLINMGTNEFEIQKRVQKRVYKHPFELMADTLQRIIFYLAAIESNKNAAILFEEPETHSFPPYIRIIGKRIVADETNQYFISTHSPYLLNTIIEDTSMEDLNVFVTYFEDYQTKVKALSKEEVSEILDDSIDAFFNLDRFTPILK